MPHTVNSFGCARLRISTGRRIKIGFFRLEGSVEGKRDSSKQHRSPGNSRLGSISGFSGPRMGRNEPRGPRSQDGLWNLQASPGAPQFPTSKQGNSITGQKGGMQKKMPPRRVDIVESIQI
ncbi:hypothetical protein N656DRAFT_543706 [Canariomyces notabilis]|uniref:Uncharacterized protein n=1 Tax=Canariomyces notabilis TaxID=2074819 RepID=A0AAN6TIX4_9PEZI|nr:hypothetical protein N656DRAFT_543706 [Canariomyces arenarius]